MTEGPEYETMYSFGGVTGVDNIDAVIAADRLADELGLDSISSGVTIAFAMELFEKGILGTEDTGGLALNFGNDEAMMTLLRLMAFREGIGDLLADGTRAAAEKIGKGTDKYAMHVKNMTPSAGIAPPSSVTVPSTGTVRGREGEQPATRRNKSRVDK